MPARVPPGPADDPDATVVRPRVDPDATVIRPRRDVTRIKPRDDPDATVIVTPGATPLPRLPESRGLPLALAPGFRLHEYALERVLGQGGFGITYLATDVHLNTRVAIKEYLPEEIAFRTGDRSVSPNATQHRDRYREGLESFLVEARTLATFRHPAIVRVARFFEAHRTAYMVLEYEEGEPLKTWWPVHRSVGEAGLVELLLPLFDGLAAVHAGGFLHRDIKPDNIQVRAADGRLVLLDFGSAGQTVAVAGQGAVVVTPGYAPLEQYGLGQQGTWTDVYALGATLYWVVTGKKPPDAELRAANPRAFVPAAEAGADPAKTGGVAYGAAFLAAIDWALNVEATQRPQTVADFRRALCAEHVASLDLQDALRGGDSPFEHEAQHSLAERAWARTKRALATAASPAAWPLAFKMTLAMVATALLPMLVAGLYNLRAAAEAVSEGELRFVEQIATSTAGRLSQFITDNRQLARALGSDTDFEEALASAAAASAAAPMLGEKLRRIVHANPDLQRVSLAGRDGRVLVSSDEGFVGRELGTEPWMHEALQGRASMTSLIRDPGGGLPGVVMVQPVSAADGSVLGATVLRLRGSSLATLVDEVRNDPSLTPFLVDRQGTLLHHLQEDLVFQPLAGVGETALAAAVAGAQSPGHAAYRSGLNARDEIAGFAPVTAHQWVLGVSKSRTDFEAPLTALYEKLRWSLLLVGLLFIGLALRFARSIVRPIRALTQAAGALKEGQYDTAGVEVKRKDELGQLGRTFNVMVDVLRQRERERRRD